MPSAKFRCLVKSPEHLKRMTVCTRKYLRSFGSTDLHNIIRQQIVNHLPAHMHTVTYTVTRKCMRVHTSKWSWWKRYTLCRVAVYTFTWWRDWSLHQWMYSGVHHVRVHQCTQYYACMLVNSVYVGAYNWCTSMCMSAWPIGYTLVDSGACTCVHQLVYIVHRCISVYVAV